MKLSDFKPCDAIVDAVTGVVHTLKATWWGRTIIVVTTPLCFCLMLVSGAIYLFLMPVILTVVYIVTGKWED